MVEGLRRLLELQQIDDDLGAAEREHAGLPDLRRGFEEARAGCDADEAQAREELGAAEAELRRAESNLQDQEALLKKLEGQQFQVKSNVAYTALLHEMEQAKQAISDSETGILEAMERIEAARAERARVEEQSRAMRARVDEDARALEEREKVLDADIARLRAERERLCAVLEPELLARYSKVAARRSPAVVRVDHEMCLGCRMDIPPQRYIEILRGEAIISCHHCQRVLVHAEHAGAA